MKDTFLIYAENGENVRALSDEQAGMVFKALFAYRETGDDPQLDDLAAKIVFQTIRKQIVKCDERYDEEREKRSQAGKIGMQNRWKHNTVITDDNKNNSVIPVITDDNKNNLSVPVPVPESVKDKKSIVRFTPPTAQQVKEYSAEKGYAVDADRFVDFYESKGWYVGKNKMKDWKAAVRNWARSQRQEPTANGRQEKAAKVASFPQRKYDMKALEKALLDGSYREGQG